MSQKQILTIIGVWVMAFLFLGLPSSWDKVIALATGLILVIMSYRLKLEEKVVQKKTSVPFVEHKQESEPITSSTPPANS